ncbi:MAG: protein kinase [Anaerolineae bacterium]|nr:protein kinase [Anaerolineae bacterium]
MDVGVEFSHYRVIEHIGRGGMADVWSARDKRLNRTVAIKTIVRGLSTDVEPVKLFEREAQTIAQLEHPHILPIYDFGEYEGQLYIVMRYVTGGSLEDSLSQGPMATEDVLRHARAIAGALDYAHSTNVIHLDLKPSNILMDSNGSPYLADFGLATVLGPEGRAANPGYGTLLYMAPEQLTAGELDHRADIYSFAILVFQMLTGELPFDATTSLALKQLQWQEDLPEVDKLGADLAERLTPVLRRGTALDPINRPDTLMQLVDELEEALGSAHGVLTPRVVDTEEFDVDMSAYITVDVRGVQTVAGQEEMAKREAIDIYNRARRVWAHGQGRFLLGVTHFMVMNDYYMRAAELGLEMDEAGLQVLLRGALEYDHEIDYWWNKLDNDNRRWVALHAIRSENPPARARSFYRLETLKDSDPPKIPALIAQALSVETNEEAKRAAIYVLGTRAKRDYPSGTYAAVNTPRGLTGRLITTRTRADIQIKTPSIWQDKVFSPDIDELLAEIALDPDMPKVADLAARTVGRIRSLAAVKIIAAAQVKGEKGALRALALVRDEAPSLPNVVSPQGRIYAWLANTWRRLSDEPLHNVWRYVLAFLGAAAAMAIQVFVTFRTEAIFNPERWGRTISIGLTFGFFMGFLVLIAGEYPARLRGFWSGWMRLLFSAVTGLLLGTLTWGAFTWFFLNYSPDWDVMAFAGIGTALGFVLTGLFSLRGWLAALITAVATYIPIYAMYQYSISGELFLPVQLTQVPILYYDYFTYPDQIFTLGLTVAILIGIGGHAQSLWQDLRDFLLNRQVKARLEKRLQSLRASR